MYNIEDIFSFFDGIKSVKIEGNKYKVNVINDLVILTRGKKTLYHYKSNIHERFTIKEDGLYYYVKNLVTGKVEDIVKVIYKNK